MRLKRNCIAVSFVIPSEVSGHPIPFSEELRQEYAHEIDQCLRGLQEPKRVIGMVGRASRRHQEALRQALTAPAAPSPSPAAGAVESKASTLTDPAFATAPASQAGPELAAATPVQGSLNISDAALRPERTEAGAPAKAKGAASAATNP